MTQSEKISFLIICFLVGILFSDWVFDHIEVRHVPERFNGDCGKIVQPQTF